MDNTCSFEVDIAEKDVQAFAQLSGDTNPLHLDAAYAKTTEFGRPIAHGSLLIGYVSKVLGMYIPGRESLILSMKIQFPKPLYYPSRVSVQGKLKSYDINRNVGVVEVKIEDKTKVWPVLEAEVTFSKHAKASTPPAKAAASTTSAAAHTPPKGRRLLVTGGTGGIGRELVSLLQPSYEIVCLTRDSTGKNNGDTLRYAQVDLEDDASLEAFFKENNPDQFFGVVHLSVPPVPWSFLSDDLPALRRHLRHAVEIPVALARWARQPGSQVRRFVLMGSTFGTKQPKPHIGAYSLAKAAMEHLTQLLTSDLASQKATINTIAASVVPLGLNEGMPERARKSLISKVPTGRLSEPRDIGNVLSFLLSDAAEQINGTTITVDGGTQE